jgi:hypothetical protein
LCFDGCAFRHFSASRALSGRFRNKETQMAGIRKKGNACYCTFRFQGRRYYFTVGDMSEAQAKAKGVEVDETLALIERGRLIVPEGVSLEEFVAAGGKVPLISARPQTATARQLFDSYLATHSNGTVEDSSLGTNRTHLNQFAETIGERFRMQSLTLLDLQRHVDRRTKKGVQEPGKQGIRLRDRCLAASNRQERDMLCGSASSSRRSTRPAT